MITTGDKGALLEPGLYVPKQKVKLSKKAKTIKKVKTKNKG